MRDKLSFESLLGLQSSSFPIFRSSELAESRHWLLLFVLSANKLLKLSSATQSVICSCVLKWEMSANNSDSTELGFMLNSSVVLASATGMISVSCLSSGSTLVLVSSQSDKNVFKESACSCSQVVISSARSAKTNCCACLISLMTIGARVR